MMLDNLQYDNILLNYHGSASNGLVLYVLYIAYCFMMPIIFLNLLVSGNNITHKFHSSLNNYMYTQHIVSLANSTTQIKITIFR